MSTETVRVRNTRAVDVDLSGLPVEERPVLTTPKGHMPMACYRVELSFDIDTGRLRSVTARGNLLDDHDKKRRRESWVNRRSGSYEPSLQRRVSVDWRTHEPAPYTPAWLLDLIDQYRPGAAA